MDSKLFRDTYTAFKNLSSVEEYIEFYKHNDFWILNVPIIRLQDKAMWDKQWGMRYDMNEHIDRENFLTELSSMGISDKQGFIDLLTGIYNEIQENGGLEFDEDNDLSVVFSQEPLEDLLCFCRKINIHAGRDVQEFTYETCLDSLYYYRATKENKYYEKIEFNEHMRDMCKSFLAYLDELTTS